MESLQGLGQIVGPARVGDRQGGNRGAANAFRRALQQQESGGQEAAAGGDRPVGTRLQRRGGGDRKDDGANPHHVDVLA